MSTEPDTASTTEVLDGELATLDLPTLLERHRRFARALI